MFMNPTLAGYLEATGVVQQIPVDEVSPYTMRHITLSKDSESRNDTSAIQYANYIDKKMRGYICSYATSCNERTETRVV